jgi:hypothetical protein
MKFVLENIRCLFVLGRVHGIKVVKGEEKILNATLSDEVKSYIEQKHQQRKTLSFVKNNRADNGSFL